MIACLKIECESRMRIRSARLLMQAQVVVLAAPKAIDLLTYAVPYRLLASIAPGHRVLVPLRSRHVTGIVVELGEQFASNEIQLRTIAEQIDPEPILDEPHMRLMRFAANYYMSSLSEAYRAAIPGAFRIETRTTIKLSHKPDPLALATLNVIEKSGFGFTEFPRVAAYLDACRARPTWVQTPRLPGL